ncbi:MAG: PEFG-CTERM sorting domain-containing protein, partial [Nitrosopumilus sp. H13]
MNTRLSVFALTVVLVASIGITPAFGQVQGPIVVMTDKESYAAGEKIIVFGEVSQRLGFAVALKVLAPNGNVVTIEQLTVGADKQFNATLTAGGGVMKFNGEYLIQVQYGDSDSRSAETTFEFTGGDIVTPPPIDEVPRITGDTIRVADSTDLITYEIVGGRILSVEPDTESKSLILTIDATEDGMVTLTIPRSVLDANTDGTDDDFIVLVDGEEQEFVETPAETHRTLVIEFLAGDTEIQIYGTFVIPEFGAIAAMILAVAIISIIAVSARSRLS